MKVDYYVGKKPTSKEERIILNGIFTKWYEIIEKQIDARIISVTTRNDLAGKVYRKFQYWSGAHLVSQRRKDCLLHIISVLVANPMAAIVSQRPLVVTCFDAIIYEPNVDQLCKRRSERTLWAHRKLLQRADRIITISEHAKNRISALCTVELDKIDVVYLAVDHGEFYPRSIDRSVRTLQRFGFDRDRKNILYVGSESPRKNLERVIRALALVRKQIDICLVKVGVPLEPYHTRLRNLVSQLDLEDTVRFLDPVAMESLPIIYNLADMFVFPSLYEGFGLPPLEALASGCPVVTSNETSLPEVVGDAAEIVDPYDHESIAAGILGVLSDERYSQSLVEKGRKQALKFSWKKTASEILDVYNRTQSSSALRERGGEKL